MIGGEALRKLKHLEDFIHSFKLSSDSWSTSINSCRLTNFVGYPTAEVSYRSPRTRQEMSELDEKYDRLKPQNGERTSR